MKFSTTDNSAFSRLLKAWNNKEDLRVAEASFQERVEANIALDHARKTIAQAPRFAHAA